MLREHCRVGMKVVCGRPNGEKTVGEVVQIHEKRAEVRTLETRGDGNRGSEEHRTKKRPAGTVWGFTFDLVEPLAPPLLEALRSLPPKHERLLEYLESGSEPLCGVGSPTHFFVSWGVMGRDEQHAILRAISSNYAHRRSFYQIVPSAWRQRSIDELNQRLGILFEAFGRPVSEAVLCAWEDDLRIEREIRKEFPDTTDYMKARRHWVKIRDEIFPHDHDHKERILLWNERRLSPAWIEAGLNEPSTATHKSPAPRPLEHHKTPVFASSPG